MSGQWSVIYYISPNGENPVKNFLDASRHQQKTKALRILFSIHEYGLHTVIPHIKKLAGTPLWEIRILGQDSMRILYVKQKEQQIVLLHAFYKKAQKTPHREIGIAMARYKQLT